MILVQLMDGLDIIINELLMKAKEGQSTLQRLINYEEVNMKRMLIQRIKDNNQEKLQEAKKDLQAHSPQNSHDPSPQTGDAAASNAHPKRLVGTTHSVSKQTEKNAAISDTDKMLFDKKFKNFLNHKQDYLDKARKGKREVESKRRNGRKNYDNLGDAEYYNEEEVLSNTGSDYQYRDADDMQAAYEQMTTGKKRRGGHKQLFHCELYENQFRRQQFVALLGGRSKEEQEANSVSKDAFINYLFDEPCVMMLYSINPYLLGDQLAEFETTLPNLLSYQEFSRFLLTDREPTYFQYSFDNLAEARKLGRGIKCAPIIAKWIDESGIFEWLLQLYHSVDMHGDGKVDQAFLAKKIRKEAEQRRFTQVEVVEVVNINKRLPLSRLLYEIQYEQRQDSDWTYSEFENFLTHYQRRNTPEKDRLITKLILAGKFDSSYVYILSQEILEIVKEVFQRTPKFAEYFVLKEKLLQGLCSDPRYKRIQGMNVRSEGNRYVKKETFEETLIRIHAEGDQYLDLEEVLDFLTNRGRPKLVEYRVYIENLERQLRAIEEQQQNRREKYGDGFQSTSSDEEHNEVMRQKRIQRKKDKILQIRSQNTFSHDKKFNVTIPTPFAFETRDKTKKVSIREQKLKEMLAEEERKLKEAMQPFRCKDVPAHVKDNLYEKLLKDQERERKERLERFRLEIMSQVHVSDHLMLPKSTEPHCHFGGEEYKFVARPMPWYCEVSLLGRINKQKSDRRERILEEIINRNTEFDLPEGVQRMIQRQDQLSQKRAAKRTDSTGSVGDCTFVPKISHGIPDFKTIHEHLHFDLENAKNIKEPIQIEPFSFENRPTKSRTAYEPKPDPSRHVRHSKYERMEPQEDFTNIPKTQKFEALVQLRRKQQEEKEREAEKEKRSEAVRRLREEKFAPIVRKVLKENDVDINKSRAVIADRIREFKRDEKRKKMEYENEMIKIYTKVFQRPLLIESGGLPPSDHPDHEDSRSPPKNVKDSHLKKSKHNKESKDNYLDGYYEDKKVVRRPEFKPQELEDERHRAVENHHPGQYPLDDEEEYEDGFHESQFYEEEYEGGNIHTN